MTVDCPVEDSSVDQWVTERERGQEAEGLQERAKRIISHLGWGPQAVGGVVGRGSYN